jgi:nickel-type superoxide dismutase maturation protease
VEGNSMAPTLRPHQRVLVYRWKKGRVGDVIVFKKNAKTMIKRIERFEYGRAFVKGDNLKDSQDSRNYGAVERHQIIGKVSASF